MLLPFVVRLPVVPAPAQGKRVCRMIKPEKNAQTFAQIIFEKKKNLQHCDPPEKKPNKIYMPNLTNPPNRRAWAKLPIFTR